jgi:uncharacterized protein
MALLDSLREVLERFPEVRLAAAFGSVARGDERPGSDVDVALLLSPDTRELRTRVEAALGRAAGREIDVIHLDAAPPLLRFEIARDGVPLLGQRDDWVDFRTRAMIDWWDWAPTARMIEEAAIRRLREKVGKAPGTP